MISAYPEPTTLNAKVTLSADPRTEFVVASGDRVTTISRSLQLTQYEEECSREIQVRIMPAGRVVLRAMRYII